MKNKKISHKVSIVMGSKSDYATMKFCEKVLKILKIRFETSIVSAHRTPERMFKYAKYAENRNISVIVAGAGGSAHLPGMIASLTRIPVIGVPIESKKLKGLDSLLSIAQMPKGIPVGTVAIGKDGAINAGLYAASIISNFDTKVKNNLIKWRTKQSKSVNKKPK
tara:strand:+ start:1469 stop:1963 length:495 start_codon:yes stop_codon:yes gene_type:complete